MEDILRVSVMVLMLVFVICNPFAVATVFHLCNRTGKYLLPAIAGVCVHVASFSVLIFVFLMRDSDSVGELLQSFDGESIILYLVAVALNGLIITAVALLVVRERKLNQTAPSKLAILLFLSIAAIWIFMETPLMDDLDADPTVYYRSLTQGPEIEFQGYTIYLGDSYVYEGSSDYLIIQKLGPGFGQVETDFTLWYQAAAAESEKGNAYWCQQEEYTCGTAERSNYRISWQTHQRQDEDDHYTTTTYYSPKCNVQLGHSGKDTEGRYTELVERFFNDNCA